MHDETEDTTEAVEDLPEPMDVSEPVEAEPSPRENIPADENMDVGVAGQSPVESTGGGIVQNQVVEPNTDMLANTANKSERVGDLEPSPATTGAEQVGQGGDIELPDDVDMDDEEQEDEDAQAESVAGLRGEFTLHEVDGPSDKEQRQTMDFCLSTPVTEQKPLEGDAQGTEEKPAGKEGHAAWTLSFCFSYLP